MIQPFKYLIQAVAVELDDETGRITKEIPGEMLTVYSAQQAATAIMEFETQIGAMNKPVVKAETNGGEGSNADTGKDRTKDRV